MAQDGDQSKVLLHFLNDEGEVEIESIWATQKGDYFVVDNIPFLAPNIALGDLISVEEEDGMLCFDSLIEESGHAVVQIVFFDTERLPEVADYLVEMGCS